MKQPITIYFYIYTLYCLQILVAFEFAETDL